jgi:hypothetical protein
MLKGSFIHLQTSAWYITVLVYCPLSSFQLIKEHGLNLKFQRNRNYHFVTKFRTPRSTQNLKTWQFSTEKTQLSKKCTFICFLRLVRVPKSELHLTRKIQLSKKCISICFLKIGRVPEPKQYLTWIIPAIPLVSLLGAAVVTN